MLWSIDEHREELARILKDVRKDIEESWAKPKKMQPPRFASYLWHRVIGKEVPAEISFNDSPGQAPRKIHNF